MQVTEIREYDGDLEADLKVVGRNQLADKITGGLSKPGKMPCPSFGLPAVRCQIGSLMAKNPKSVCHPSNCYAKKGRYRFPHVQRKYEQRFEGLRSDLWTPAMVFLIRYYCEEYFRWFCSGDIQGENHLRNIVRIAQEVPEVKMWLPTREAGVVRSVGHFPENLTVRVSGHMVDGPAPDFPTVSRVTRKKEEVTCPSRQQQNSCQDCRKCWDQTVPEVVYQLH